MQKRVSGAGQMPLICSLILFAHGGLQCILRLMLRLYMRPYFVNCLSPNYPNPNASLGRNQCKGLTQMPTHT